MYTQEAICYYFHKDKKIEGKGKGGESEECILGMLSVITFMNETKKGGETSKNSSKKEYRDHQHA